ncbi:TorF family putative porin [Paraferrimonas sp. SM1919]|uniref:TorF family putative porin n=1 Tax=Paraferrimonas sp. SM1919 TaxID=2662263 RepID=UPI0013D1067A|nr:TorF family putative porin [Paraferrimonas sp. SM1919]
MQNKHIYLLGTFLCGVTFSQNAQAEFSGYITGASNYLFRGESQTNNNPAFQAGLDYEHDSGLYVGAWGSNYKTDDNKNDVELNWFGGYGFDITDDLYVDFGVIRYHYVDAGGHTTEWNANLEYLGLGFSFHYDEHEKQYYYELNYGVEFSDDFTLDLHAGQKQPNSGKNNYDLGANFNYTLYDTFDLFAGAVYHETSKEAFIAGVNINF